MTLRLVGAGLPRTATKSLQLALERLLGGRCYHMHEVFAHLDHVPVWRAALRGEAPVWEAFLADYVAAVDWPASAFYRELAEANPDAVILLSLRDDPESWWRSADETILEVARKDELPEYGDWLTLFRELLEAYLGERWDDAETAMAAYERHNDDVRAAFPSDRLVEWRPGDGWQADLRSTPAPTPTGSFPARQHDRGVAGGCDLT